VRDYKKGALGNVRELSSAYLEYLRIASDELTDWENDNKERELKKRENESRNKIGHNR